MPTPPIDLAAERAKRRPGRPLTPNGILDAAALALIDARCTLVAAVESVADDLRTADTNLRHLRDTLGGKAAA